MLKIGVIGAERRGKIARLAHQPENGIHLVAASTLHPERIAGMKEIYGPDFFITGDYRELLRQPLDAVFICTPDYLHEEHTLAAMEAGKAIYLEKPMAISVEGCDRILAAAKARGTLLYLGHNMRFSPVMQKMKALIDAGTIGEVQSIWCRHFISYGGDAYFKDWHSERRHSHGLLLQKGAHDIDVIHWLAGAYTRRVVGMGKLSVYDKLPRRHPDTPQPPVVKNNDHWPPATTTGYSPNIDVEDSSMILMQLANGVQACYLQSHYTPDDVRNYTIIGTEGRIENYGDRSTEEREAAIHVWNRRSGYQEQGHVIHKVPYLAGAHGGSDPRIVQEFLDVIQGKPASKEAATPLDARMSVATGYHGTESLRNGNCPCDIPPVNLTCKSGIEG
ncbi:MAG TPA: Gfo/Idh/MocA family oxidoreductase [Chthoniobacteraceae bacterium]|nr:Gfo/Idh/MocA family oxidoreductase [Chthoniobacteraceae bacterium]